jgi:3-methylfumaryl-CoA hydratase
MNRTMALPLEALKDWVGRKDTATDTACAWPVAAMQATLDLRERAPEEGDEVPAGWHWLFLLETAPASKLGHEGHTKLGGFLPPVPLPRRMWAGGRLEFLRPLYIGDALRRDSEVIAVEPKTGRSGDLVFVTVRHTITASREIAVVEEHDIVYREAARADEPPPAGRPAPTAAAWRHELVPDAVMLFRFSALIFNAHRIHYDADYTRNEAHYPALVVHGPLQTLSMLELCRRHAGSPVKRLEYRALHPVFMGETLRVCGEPAQGGARAELWTANGAGHYAMRGTAFF